MLFRSRKGRSFQIRDTGCLGASPRHASIRRVRTMRPGSFSSARSASSAVRPCEQAAPVNEGTRPAVIAKVQGKRFVEVGVSHRSSAVAVGSGLTRIHDSCQPGGNADGEPTTIPPIVKNTFAVARHQHHRMRLLSTGPRQSGAHQRSVIRILLLCPFLFRGLTRS